MTSYTQKEHSISARLQRRKPVIGEKSQGGKAMNIITGDFSTNEIISSGKKKYTKPSAITRNIMRARKQRAIPGVTFIHDVVLGPENPFFRETIVFYHHKKDDMPREKTLKNDGQCYFSDIKNDRRRKSHKGEMKRSINIADYYDV